MKKLQIAFVVLAVLSLSVFIPIYGGRNESYTIFENEETLVVYSVSSASVRLKVIDNTKLRVNISFFNPVNNKSTPVVVKLEVSENILVQVPKPGFYWFSMVSQNTTVVKLSNEGLSTPATVLLSFTLTGNVLLLISHHMKNKKRNHE